MAKINITPKTPEEIAGDFAAVFKDVKPIKPQRALTQADRLAPYRKQIMKQRQRGLNWAQIAEGMAQPRINEKVSAQLLKKVFGAAKPKPAPTPPAAPPPRRMILDATTGQPVVVPPPPVAPMTAPEQAKYDPILKELIPAIVKAKMARNDGLAYARLASERLRPKEVDRFLAIATNMLDRLTEADSVAYGITSDAFAAWKRRWG